MLELFGWLFLIENPVILVLVGVLYLCILPFILLWKLIWWIF